MFPVEHYDKLKLSPLTGLSLDINSILLVQVSIRSVTMETTRDDISISLVCKQPTKLL